MEPILKWQYDQIVKELLLLQEHQEDPTCPCETGGEMCTRKHLMTVEAYAEETLSIESKEDMRLKLMQLAKEARDRRMREEEALCGENGPAPDLLDWTRDRRKEFESVSLACSTEEREGEQGNGDE